MLPTPVPIPVSPSVRATGRTPSRVGIAGWAAASVALAVIAVLALGAQASLLPALALAAVAPRLIVVDLAEHRLPNRLVVPTIATGVLALPLSWVLTGVPPLVPALAAVAFGGSFTVIAFLGGIGMGDAKLAFALGLAAPSATIALLSPLLTFTVGGIAALIALVRRGRHAQLAFGPFLLLGYFAALAVGALAAALSRLTSG